MFSKKDFLSDIVLDSINPNGNRVTTFLLTYPRFIHSEIMTHRVFSRNAASSRAIPITKVLDQVAKNPAGPVRWGKNGKGMQDHGEFVGEEIKQAEEIWIDSANRAIESANALNAIGLHKQIVNRVLEPFMWMTTLVTATEWENFFSLRLHKDAQPEFQYLAYIMLKAYLESEPSKKEWGEWHIPFCDKIEDVPTEVKLKIATAMAARTSYLKIGDMNRDADIKLHDVLAENGHWSPFEHSCYAGMESRSNFSGWVQYRSMFANEKRTCNLRELLKSYEASIADHCINGKSTVSH
jgi:thymidylate synthase ThyX